MAESVPRVRRQRVNVVNNPPADNVSAKSNGVAYAQCLTVVVLTLGVCRIAADVRCAWEHPHTGEYLRQRSSSWADVAVAAVGWLRSAPPSEAGRTAAGTRPKP
jgi:hypothetical protein